MVEKKWSLTLRCDDRDVTVELVPEDWAEIGRVVEFARAILEQ